MATATRTYHKDADAYLAREIKKERIRALAAGTSAERLQHEVRELRLKQTVSVMRRAFGEDISYRSARGRKKEPSMKPISAMTRDEYLDDLRLRIKDARRKAEEADNEDAQLLYGKQADVLERILERESRTGGKIERPEERSA